MAAWMTIRWSSVGPQNLTHCGLIGPHVSMCSGLVLIAWSNTLMSLSLSFLGPCRAGPPAVTKMPTTCDPGGSSPRFGRKWILGFFSHYLIRSYKEPDASDSAEFDSCVRLQVILDTTMGEPHETSSRVH